MNTSHEIRKFAAKLAETNPKFAYELNELADTVARSTSESKVASTDTRFAQLRSVVIRTAASDAVAKKTLLPVLQVIQNLG